MITMLDGKYQLTLHRVYNASKDKVFQAWTKVEQLKQWWGITGFTTTVERMDVVVGGMYRFQMASPHGTIHILEGRYVDIVPNERLSFTWKWVNEGDNPEETLVTIDFIDKDGKTELVMLHTDFTTIQGANRHNNSWTNVLERGLCNYME
ncbi:SRPBCC family protein [Paenibacillus guangzhouensis]|uniref:SRPBCC family protein n=1 Tax=Paenibacillus guangzhouensis TaxID=1473112 RepID=UPI0012672755|nr:SRPBCC domain-containing protein [Paenibacillus guangzhouensis]